MSFFSKLFGQKTTDKPKSESESVPPLPVITTKPDLQYYKRVVGTIVVSEGLKTELNTKLEQAFENPKSFYNESNDFTLSERGLSYPQNVSLTSKFVLVDTLIANDHMTEVDWKSSETEVRAALNHVMTGKNYSLSIPINKIFNKNDTFETIQAIDAEELRPAGYSLQLLDIDSDSYVFTIVPLEQEQEVIEMFEKLR
jgi:hypothetical protein